jgi:DUF177 domain-containing protein
MLSYDLRALESKAVQVDDYLPADDPVWQEGDLRPAEALHVTGRLSPAGAGRYYWHGRIVGAAVGACRRCLADVAARAHDEAHIIFAEAGDESRDDPDVYELDPHARELDLRPAVREQWLLIAPAYTLCRDDCLGLCPKCGADLNAGPCECTPAAAVRQDAPRKRGSASGKRS